MGPHRYHDERETTCQNSLFSCSTHRLALTGRGGGLLWEDRETSGITFLSDERDSVMDRRAKEGIILTKSKNQT